MEPGAKFGIRQPLDFQGPFGCSNHFIKRGGPPHLSVTFPPEPILCPELQPPPRPSSALPPHQLSCACSCPSPAVHVPCSHLRPEPSDPIPEICQSAPRPVTAVPLPPLHPTTSAIAAAVVAAQTRDCRALIQAVRARSTLPS